MIYVGAKGSKDPHGDSYLGSGTALIAAIEAEGKADFRKDIIAIFDNPEEASALEEAIVTREFVDRADTYNLRPKGGKYPDSAQRKKFAQAKLGGNNPMFERDFTTTHRRRLSDAQRGKKRSSEHRAHISASIKAHWEKRRAAH